MDELDYNYLAELVLKTQRGDSEAFAELYTATYQKQYRFAYRYAKDAYLAQDILQDVYILVLKNINALKNPRLFDMLPSYRTMKYKSPIWGYFHVQKE